MIRTISQFFHEPVDYEECFILEGTRNRFIWQARPTRFSTDNTLASVKFNYDYALKNRHRIVGWLHNHPNMPASPSSTDRTTMHAWFFTLGKPLVCCIYGSDGLKAHWYMDDENSPVEKRVMYFNGRLFGLTPRK
tara:strand:+ start:842 stop:1246 length:405 start_codon:yes stop_codon:yes gene_type:complete